MLYRIGTQREISVLYHTFPECVIQELTRYIAILDKEYGDGRNYLETGGYALIAETIADVSAIKDTIDYDNHLCEWAEAIGKHNEYISALYLLNNDYSILVLVPTVIAPSAIWTETED